MKKLLLASIVATSLMGINAFAGTTKVEDVAINLKKNNEGLPPIKEIRPTPLENIYEVIVNDSDIFYSDADGKYLFFGNLVKVENGKRIQLTEERVNQLNTVDFSKFNFKDALVKKVGNGKDKLVTFEDPNCGFCKRLQPELEKLNNVTIYTFILPVLGPKSEEASKAVWCSKEPLKSWEEYFKTAVAPKVDKKCDTSALDRNLAFARKYKINGTPTMFLENGRRLPGFLPADKIMEAMSQK